MGTIIIRSNGEGFAFVVQDNQGQTILTSPFYRGLASCQKGASSLMRTAPRARLEDHTAGQVHPVVHPKFEVCPDDDGMYQYRLKAKNGQVIASGGPYADHDTCLAKIEELRSQVTGARVMEQITQRRKPASTRPAR